MESNVTANVKRYLQRMHDGDTDAQEELLECACVRLRQLASKMLNGYSRVRRWEETDDVFSNAMIRLHRSLKSVTPESPLHFFRLAALQIRRELIDLSRKHYGKQGVGANHESISPQTNDEKGHSPLEAVDPADNPVDLAVWTELHEEVEKLSEEEKEVFDLVWYHQLTQVQAAEVLNVSRRTVLRRWQSACLRLHEVLFSNQNLSPESNRSRKE